MGWSIFVLIGGFIQFKNPGYWPIGASVVLIIASVYLLRFWRERRDKALSEARVESIRDARRRAAERFRLALDEAIGRSDLIAVLGIARSAGDFGAERYDVFDAIDERFERLRGLVNSAEGARACADLAAWRFEGFYTRDRLLFEGELRARSRDVEGVRKLLGPYINSRKQEDLASQHEYLYLYAKCLEGAGHGREALVEYRKVARRVPGYLDVGRRIDTLSSATRKDEEDVNGEPRADSRASKKRAVDSYKILGVPRNATRAAIDAAFREQVALYHPDKVASLGKEFQDLAHRKMTELNWAREECLKNLR